MKKTCDKPGCDEPAEVRGKCKPHYNRWYAEERKKHGGLGLKERGVSEPAPKVGQVKEEEACLKAGSRLYFKFDFSNCPELLDELKKAAAEELRSVNSQALYLIREGLKDA